MFNMEKVGRNIAKFRRDKNMTQMELADKMGISFQAVSNWERGQSMPDISKLPELATLFGITIDQLLGEHSGVIESAANGDMQAFLKNNDVTVEEIRNAAPILKPEQVDEIMEQQEIINLREIEDLLPFLGRSVIDKIALKLAQGGKYRDLDCILPFTGTNVINEIVQIMVDAGESLEDIAPFVSKDVLSEQAEKLYNTSGLSAIEDLIPFLPKEFRHRIADMEFCSNGLRDMDMIASFLNREYLNELARKAIQRDGIKAISNLAPFLDKSALAEFVKEAYL